MNLRTIDRRPKLHCDCGCGQRATLPHFRILTINDRRRFILPGCERIYREEQAALEQLRGLMRAHKTWGARLPHVASVYRLQRQIHARRATGRRTAFRSAMMFALPRKAGLLLAKFWKW